jgi:phosphatidylserine/phosphatidylglycerophosphate/cardiolipin synthase-like enzyme
MKKNIYIAIFLAVCVILLMNPRAEQSVNFTLSKDTPVKKVRLRILPLIHKGGYTDDDHSISQYGCNDTDHLIPMGGRTYEVISEIEYAKTEILVQAYSSFTSANIAKALLDAHKRGVNIQLILVESPRILKYINSSFPKTMSIPYMTDDEYAIAHNKTMIIDREIVITGSFNFTKVAKEKNAENLMIIRDKGLAKVYIEKWEEYKRHSEMHGGI